MAAAEVPVPAPAPPPEPGEAKRSEGDEWCDSGLGSLGEGQLGPLPASPGASGSVREEDEEEKEKEKEAVAEPPGPAVDPAAWLRHVLSFMTEDGDTALHLAVIHEHQPFLESILLHTAGTAYLDLQNHLGQTALHLAVVLGLPGLVQQLLGAGAGRGVRERGGQTPLHLACREGHPQCARLLLGGTPKTPQNPPRDPHVDAINYDGYTPLHLAVLRRDLQLVQLLVGAGADLNKPEPGCGRSPLHLAVETQSPEVTEWLLRAGALPSPQSSSGCTPLDSALLRPDPRIPALISSYGGCPGPGGSDTDGDSETDEDGDGDSEDEYDDIVINSRRCPD